MLSFNYTLSAPYDLTPRLTTCYVNQDCTQWQFVKMLENQQQVKVLQLQMVADSADSVQKAIDFLTELKKYLS